ncbi:MAG: hypothetical protein SFT93_05715 [Rickettsiaceae bacterium]|nr:hypothetical protein [Rickettsiaceae bacterium]
MTIRHQKTFARRIGKRLSDSQKRLLNEELPKKMLSTDDPLRHTSSYKAVHIEVGIGMGEHFISQCSSNSDDFFIGSDPYLNGIANCLRLAKINNISNFALWPDDALLFIDKLEENTISKFYLLFPDPWQKNKQIKRRFGSESNLKKILYVLKPQGEFIFASDIEEYSYSVENILLKLGLKGNVSDSCIPHPGYQMTKFHQKALLEDRAVKFLSFVKY